MKKLYFALFFITQISFSQEITLKHNIGNTIIDQLTNPSCTGGGVDWARVFVLEDFGVTGEYTLTSGSFGIEEANTSPGEGVTIHVYAIDEGFPGTFDESTLLGSSELIDIPPTGNTIFSFDFPAPIAIPIDVEIILVEVSLAFQTQNVFMGGTMDSFDFSWIKASAACIGEFYQSTFDLGYPDTNYYITVTGDHLLGYDDKNKKTFSIAPNPVREKLTIKMSEAFEFSEILIYDINGKTMLQSNQVGELDLSDFSSGLYFLKVISPKGSISRKFMKQ
jgi:type IX secretion system substrate protein